jgi:hypothetical protein
MFIVGLPAFNPLIMGFYLLKRALGVRIKGED